MTNATTTQNESKQAEAIQVLIIDDDPDWILECTFMLKHMGYAPSNAMNARDALIVAKELAPRIVLVDYQLPDGDGIALIEQLDAQAQENGRELYFIMATGHGTIDLAIAAMRASTSDFLQKPIPPQRFKDAFQRVQQKIDAANSRASLINTLSSMSGELQQLANISSSSERSEKNLNDFLEAEGNRKKGADYVRSQLENENRRKSIGNGELFGDPSWILLLNLLLAKLEGRNLSVSNAIEASSLPNSTALRLIKRLIENGIIEKTPDTADRRREFVILTDKMQNIILDYLAYQTNDLSNNNL